MSTPNNIVITGRDYNFGVQLDIYQKGPKNFNKIGENTLRTF